MTSIHPLKCQEKATYYLCFKCTEVVVALNCNIALLDTLKYQSESSLIEMTWSKNFPDNWGITTIDGLFY